MIDPNDPRFESDERMDFGFTPEDEIWQGLVDRLAGEETDDRSPLAEGPIGRLSDAVDELDRELAQLESGEVLITDAWRVGQEMVALRRHIERCERAFARRAALFEEQNGHRVDGAVTAGAWIAARSHLTKAQAAAKVKLGRRLRSSEEVDEAWRAGRIGERAASHLLNLRRAAPESFDESADLLVDFAGFATPEETVAVCRQWRDCLTEDDGKRSFEKRHEARRLEASMSAGALHGRFSISDDDAAIVMAAIEAGFQIGFDLDRADDRITNRDPAQLRADVLVEMALAYLAKLAADGHDGARVRPTVSAVVDYDTLSGDATEPGRCHIDRAGVLSPETMRRLCCDADIVRVVVDGESVPLDMGRKVRTATGHQRRALEIRDGGCCGPACDRPPWWSDVHHIQHWSQGGPSDLDNMVLLCRRHHVMVHERGWKISRGPDGKITWTPPNS